MVDESDETASKVSARLKLILQILAFELPLLNCHNCLASGTEKTRMTVPLSEAVASIVPVELRERCAIGDLCAWTTFKAESEMVSNNKTSPVVGGGGGPGTADDNGVDVKAEGDG